MREMSFFAVCLDYSVFVEVSKKYSKHLERIQKLIECGVLFIFTSASQRIWGKMELSFVHRILEWRDKLSKINTLPN